MAEEENVVWHVTENKLMEILSNVSVPSYTGRSAHAASYVCPGSLWSHQPQEPPQTPILSICTPIFWHSKGHSVDPSAQKSPRDNKRNHFVNHNFCLLHKESLLNSFLLII